MYTHSLLPSFRRRHAFHAAAVGVLSFFAIIAVSCDNSFDPKAPFEERLVVFSILDPRSPMQIVRIESNYDAELGNIDQTAQRREISQATVYISEYIGSTKRDFLLRDTVITDGGGTQRKVWMTRDFRPVERRQYELQITVQGYPKILASIQMPGKAFLRMESVTTGAGPKGVRLVASSSATGATKGYYFRMWVTAEKIVGSDTIRTRLEVPYGRDEETGDYLYPEPSRNESLLFSSDYLITMRERLAQDPALTNYQVVAEAYALESGFYNYFKTVRGFDDPVSVRQDRPDITNINNGIGVFGGIVLDSVKAAYLSVINP